MQNQYVRAFVDALQESVGDLNYLKSSLNVFDGECPYIDGIIPDDITHKLGVTREIVDSLESNLVELIHNMMEVKE